MLKKEHIKQASSEKVIKFTKEVFAQAINKIEESDGYLNDTEKIMTLVLLGSVIYDSSSEVIGSEGVNLILDYIEDIKENSYGKRNEDN